MDVICPLFLSLKFCATVYIDISFSDCNCLFFFFLSFSFFFFMWRNRAGDGVGVVESGGPPVEVASICHWTAIPQTPNPNPSDPHSPVIRPRVVNHQQQTSFSYKSNACLIPDFRDVKVQKLADPIPPMSSSTEAGWPSSADV